MRRLKYLSTEKGVDAKLRKSHMRRARENSATGILSKGIVKSLMILQRGLCVACRCCIIKSKPHLDHIIALSKGGENIDNNVQLLS